MFFLENRNVFNVVELITFLEISLVFIKLVIPVDTCLPRFEVVPPVLTMNTYIQTSWRLENKFLE